MFAGNEPEEGLRLVEANHLLLYMTRYYQVAVMNQDGGGGDSRLARSECKACHGNPALRSPPTRLRSGTTMYRTSCTRSIIRTCSLISKSIGVTDHPWGTLPQAIDKFAK